MATQAIDQITDRGAANRLAYANFNQNQQAPSTARPLSVQVGQSTFSGSNDRGRVSVANLKDPTQRLSFYQSSNGTVDPRSIRTNNLSRNQSLALIRGAGGTLPPPPQVSSGRLSSAQNQLDQIQQQLNNVGLTSPDAATTIQNLSAQLAQLSSAVQGMQSTASSAKPSQTSPLQSLLDQIAQLTQNIANMVKALGGTPASAPDSSPDATASPASTQDSRSASNGATKEQPKKDTFGKLLDVGEKLAEGIPGIGPVVGLVKSIFG